MSPNNTVPFDEVVEYLQATHEEPPVDIEFVNVPETREEAVFDADEEDTLFDAYQMLRWVGVPREKLAPIAVTIELTTIYDRVSLEYYYRVVINDEDEDVVQQDLGLHEE